MIKTILDLNLNFDHLSNYKQEDYLEYKILECLQKTQQSLTRSGIREYIISHDPYLINAELKNINIRLSFALTSLLKGKFIYHPKRGLTALTALGKHVSLSDHEHIHQQVLEGLERACRIMNKQEQVRQVLLMPIVVTSETNHIFKYHQKVYSSQSYPSGLDQDMSDFTVGFYERFYHRQVLKDGKFISLNYAGDTINTGVYEPHQRRKTKLANRHCLANFWLIPYVDGRKGQKPKRDYLDLYLKYVVNEIAEHDGKFSKFETISEFKQFHQIPPNVSSSTLLDQRKSIEERATLIAESKYSESLWEYFNKLGLC